LRADLDPAAFLFDMKLLIIYGAPAAGKHTVGTELARMTGFRLFHNHLSIDCVKPIIDFGSPEFWRVNVDVRAAIISGAARAEIDVIQTFVYDRGVDDHYFMELIDAAEKFGGAVHLVLLVCDKEERKLRMGNESRVRLGKLTDPEAVDRSKCRMDEPFPGRETLIIDTTKLPPEAAAKRIVEHFGLMKIEL
jgi:AAA domain